MKNDAAGVTASSLLRRCGIVARLKVGKTSLSFSVLTAARVHHYAAIIVVIDYLTTTDHIFRSSDVVIILF